jgi:hypothetical protein
VFSNHERYFWPPDGGTLAPLRVVDNQSWYQAMNIVDFLSTVGRYFRIGTSFLPRLCGINFTVEWNRILLPKMYLIRNLPAFVK